MRWRVVALDGAVAGVAFLLSAGALAGGAPFSGDVRHPDLGAYALVAVYSGSAAIRRRFPEAAVGAALAAGVAFAASNYPTALTPVGLLSVYTAAAELPPRRARVVLAVAVAMSAVRRGASCSELFDQRARFDDEDTLGRIDRDLRRIGCTSPDATRTDR